MALSDTWLKSNHKKTQEKTTVKTDRDGLAVRVSPKGKLTFQLRYRYGGEQQRIDLGSYPLMSLKDARKETTRLNEILADGYNPKSVKGLEKLEKLKAKTFGELFYEWHADDAVGRLADAAEIKRSFEKHILPTYGDTLAKEITTRHWIRLLKDIGKKVPVLTFQLLTYAKQTYRWAMHKYDDLDSNPLLGISPKADLRITRGKKDRILSEKTIAQYWDAAENSRMYDRSKLFLRLMLLYGCRGKELATSKREHFDFDEGIWTIPSSEHKTGRTRGHPPIHRPIIPVAEAWLKEAMELSQSEVYVFPHLLDLSLPLSKGTVIEMPKSIQRWVYREKGEMMDYWSTHDVRRTARTHWSSLTSRDIAEMMLGHVLPGVQQVYDRYNYMDEKREAYEAWWDKIQTIVK